MDEIPDLKLIQAVDPTKIKVAINEKFSKLTLSSNKKKLLAENCQLTDPVAVEKRQSASRNLLSELCDDNDDNGDKNKKDQIVFFVNAILRSSSLSCENLKDTVQRTETLTQTDNLQIEEFNTTGDTMERLQMSEDFYHQKLDEVEELVKKVSFLEVSNTERRNTTRSVPTIDIPSSSEDEQVDESEESAIYISDTSVESNVEDLFKDFDFLATSDLQTSAEKGVPQMPCTLSNERADRIEAFLRDVSRENKNMQATGRFADDSILSHVTSKNENDLLESVKAKLIATAETESMSPTEAESNKDVKFLSVPKRNFAFDDTEVMSESAQIPLQPIDSGRDACSSKGSDESEDVRRFANDDTEVNTTSNSLEKSFKSNAPEDSLVVPETSSDDISSSSDVMLTPTENKEMIPSEEVANGSIRQDSIQHSQIGLSVCSINISAKINIKLQINANFSTSEDENNESYGNSSPDVHKISENRETINEDNVSLDEVSKISENTSQANSRNASKQKAKIIKNPITESIVKRNTIYSEEQNTEENELNFMSNAQKLLTELYGNSWQTPEVIRTLKRTSAEGQENSLFKITEKKDDRKKTNLKEKDNKKNQNQLNESILDDFSLFRFDIAQTNLDSTRLITPKPAINKKFLLNQVQTESKSYSKRNLKKDFKIPQSEFKKKTIGRITRQHSKPPGNERWRQIVDNETDSDDNNITDDTEVDQTLISDDEEKSNASDSSWQKSADDVITDDENSESPKRNLIKIQKKTKKKSQKDSLIYLDLSKDEVTILEKAPNHSPPANKDENFSKHLSEILNNCTYQDRPKLEATPKSTGKSKRRLFTVNYDDEFVDDSIKAICRGETPKKKTSDLIEDNLENVRFNGEHIPRSFNILNKYLEAAKTGKPVYKITPKRGKDFTTPVATREEGTPFRNKEQNVNYTPIKVKEKRKLDDILETPSLKYSFLKSLDVCVGKSLCHPDALIFRENYRQKKEDLAKILYELYNRKLFCNNLNVPIVWNKKLLNTAGRCLNKKKLGQRQSVVELSDKVLTSADRLRCTLIHELCHAATWIFSGEGGHGATWKEWARKANSVFPDLPKIGVCHQYDIEYKYTYKCTLCAAKSYYHSKSKKVENIRCSYCYGAIEIFLNKKDKDGNIMPTPVKKPTGFAKFVKENYQQYKRPDMKHAEIMKLLSNEFSALKVAGNTN